MASVKNGAEFISSDLGSGSSQRLTDTHCHIHENNYPLEAEAVYQRAMAAGVDRLICVGTDGASSVAAVRFAASHDHAWASIGLHPHDAEEGGAAIEKLKQLIEEDNLLGISTVRGAKITNDAKRPAGKIVAVGECGLDYFYDNSPRDTQRKVLRAQIELALAYDKPLIFHVRDAVREGRTTGEAFNDFWQIFKDYRTIRGVLHSFTDSQLNMEKAIDAGLYIGVNGISTFTKDTKQKEMFTTIPLERLLLETDAPFLTPTPLRGNVNEPAYVMCIAKHLAATRSISLDELATATTSNATKLFFN